MNEKRDWGGYRKIADEARDASDDERRNPSPACPLCGTVLDVNARGQRNCPLGHYRDNGVPSGNR